MMQNEISLLGSDEKLCEQLELLLKRKGCNVVSDSNKNAAIIVVEPLGNITTDGDVLHYPPIAKIDSLRSKLIYSFKLGISLDTLTNCIADYSDGKRWGSNICSDRQSNNNFYHAVRKIVDLSFAISIAILFCWLFVLLAIIVKLSSKGPAIFAQTRVGRAGTEFTCYKFRTMTLGTKNAATHQVDAANITVVGNFLRKSKLDELPQVWNILKNEMSLIGARPCLPVQTELVEKRQSFGILDDLPGITGWAQINDIDMSNPEKLSKKEAEYLALRTLVLDWKILLATVIGKGNGDRVARK